MYYIKILPEISGIYLYGTVVHQQNIPATRVTGMLTQYRSLC